MPFSGCKASSLQLPDVIPKAGASTGTFGLQVFAPSLHPIAIPKALVLLTSILVGGQACPCTQFQTFSPYLLLVTIWSSDVFLSLPQAGGKRPSLVLSSWTPFRTSLLTFLSR